MLLGPYICEQPLLPLRAIVSSSLDFTVKDSTEDETMLAEVWVSWPRRSESVRASLIICRACGSMSEKEMLCYLLLVPSLPPVKGRKVSLRVSKEFELILTLTSCDILKCGPCP